MKFDKKKVHRVIFSASACLLLGTGFFVVNYYQKLFKKYENKTYQGMTVNGLQISNIDLDKLQEKFKEIEETIISKKINIILEDKKVSIDMKDLSPVFNSNEIINDIKKDVSSLSYKEKLDYINGKKLKDYVFSINFDDSSIDSISKKIFSEINSDVVKEKISVNSKHEVVYSSGSDGYKVDEEKSKKLIKDFFNNRKKEILSDSKNEFDIKIVGNVTKHNVSNLSTINKKISSYSTSFSNVGNRGHNVSFAVKLINNTIIQPNETFSFRKVAGPYSCAIGYKSALAQNSTGHACGGGVCQVATTLYNAQLLAGLQTTMRYNHGEAVPYVPKGQDATVYADFPDYRFKNQYKYPIYIVSYVEKSKVVIDIWSNDKALDGHTFKVESSYNGKGGYLTYLLKYNSDGKLDEKKLLHTTYYKK